MVGTYTPQMHLARDSNRNTRIVVAMSGGVDSSVTAALMARQGYDIVGITLQLYDHGAAIRRKGACCAGQDIHDAKRVASQLGIPHYVLDYEERFRKAVISDFAASYARGETPIPCVRCNERVKFADLLAIAQDLGASALATGHYVRRVESSAGAELHMAADATRDQSYFLFRTTREQLSFLRFPLGELQKSEVRSLATELGLIVAEKPDSQDICFVPNGDYASVIRQLDNRLSAPGEIADLDGNVLGMHRGIVQFTVGQRKGLGVSGKSEPLFVLHIDAPRRRVTVGPREALRVRTIRLKEVNWLTSVSGPLDCMVKVRSTRPPVVARVIPTPEDEAIVEIPAGEEAVAPGQACVFYENGGTRILGGGWIATTEISRAAA
jgi:tRNA-specific 2-thiouridylase